MTTAEDRPEPPWWTPRKTRAPRRSLSREVIVAAALRMLRAEGVDGVTMRRVAAELGTGPASLYAHVANKDELMDLVFDEIAGDIPIPEPDPARWREQIVALWTDVYHALSRNGDIAHTALARVPLGPNSMRISEFTLALLYAAGVPRQAVAWSVDVLALFVSANAVEDTISADLERQGRDRAEYYEKVGDYFASLPAEQFPMTVELGPDLSAGDKAERFAFGLDMIVEGLASRIPRDAPDRR
ncbi:TetR/AcrR family transcriptional regulator [Actinokineospora enzanensis]|uniref:TetR/AcrR family transcriptional regulator n=1 Tax=Actinokineospora enzanensis TaxID=155975 RepID=UPI0012EBD6D2|nr:TetR/AcrR family transcriptional regulator [Actinokineospora enzanensis]